MSEYWKSNAKKYCEICKCWFADNKISVENHEKGLRHKGMVQARLREVSKKANETERANEKLASTLMQMEQAAIMSMNGAVRSSGGPSIGPSPRGAAALPKIERKSEYEEAKAKVKAEKDRMKELKRTAKTSTLWQDDEHQQKQQPQHPIPNPYLPGATSKDVGKSEGIEWVETAAEDGKNYYFNIYTGDTRWDAPVNFYTMDEYQQYYAQIVASTSLEGTEYDAFIDPSMSQQYYTNNISQSVPIQTIEPISKELIPEKLTYSPEPKRQKIKQEEVQSEKQEISSTADYDMIKPELQQLEEQFNQEQQQSKEQENSRAKTSAGGLLGGWVPVEKKPEIVVKEEKPSIVLDDLPEEATQVKEVAPTFDELEAAELTFEERKAPVSIGSKKTKVVEFKKRKAINRNVRAREEF